MSGGLTSQQIVQWLISMLGGGLAGSALAIFYSLLNAKHIANAKEQGIIAALAGELKRSSLLCEHNARLRTQAIAPFVHFPTIAALNATFEERHSYPRLADLQQELEYYTLSVVHINELIDLYRLLVPSYDTSRHQPGIDRNTLRDEIAAICKGDKKLEGIGPEDSIVFPTFIDHLRKQIEGL